jgi:alpha-glucosidase
MQKDDDWWKRGVIYEVCVPTFQDSNGDGIGDLPGVRQRLDYLQWLGVDALWLTPFFPTLLTDFGYDIIDHAAVDPRMGTLDDFDGLLADVHARGMRVILDLVPNHTSDHHAWFRESAASRTSEKRNWYVWADPAPGGGPPNNWQSDLGGSAWRWHAASRQYFYTAFAEDQPDLNWRAPRVREAIAHVMRFWLDRGVDGFRVDVLWHLAKDQLLRDNPANPDFNPAKDSSCKSLVPAYSADQPDVHDFVAKLREIIDSYDQRLLIGEVYLPIGELVRYYGVERSGVHLPFNFQLIQQSWNAREIRRAVDEYEGSVRADEWPNWVLGNHDQPRVATRIGRDQARVAALLVLTLRGTPTLYNGDELGMLNADIKREDMLDPRARSCEGKGIGRDPFRTPMQWDSSPQAGFTAGKPWLPLAGDHAETNVAAQRDDADSMLALHRELLALRKTSRALCTGSYLPIPVDDADDVFAYARFAADEAYLVALNLSDVARRFTLSPRISDGEVVLSTRERGSRGRRVSRDIELRPHEGLLVRLDHPPQIATSTMKR